MSESSISRVVDLISQFSEVQSKKEEIKDTESVDSTVEKKFKVHFKGVKPKESLKTDSDWKKLCSANFDFVK